jgi:hypothetical protein
VSHFVVKGKAKPKGVTLGGRAGTALFPASELDDSTDAVLASALSRYVFKRGRKTMRPEEIMRELKLISDGGGISEIRDEGLADEKKSASVWDETRIELERCKGEELARSFTALDDLHRTFSGDNWPALEIL